MTNKSEVLKNVATGVVSSVGSVGGTLAAEAAIIIEQQEDNQDVAVVVNAQGNPVMEPNTEEPQVEIMATISSEDQADVEVECVYGPPPIEDDPDTLIQIDNDADVYGGPVDDITPLDDIVNDMAF